MTLWHYMAFIIVDIIGSGNDMYVAKPLPYLMLAICQLDL